MADKDMDRWIALLGESRNGKVTTAQEVTAALHVLDVIAQTRAADLIILESSDQGEWLSSPVFQKLTTGEDDLVDLELNDDQQEAAEYAASCMYWPEYALWKPYCLPQTDHKRGYYALSADLLRAGMVADELHDLMSDEDEDQPTVVGPLLFEFTGDEGLDTLADRFADHPTGDGPDEESGPITRNRTRKASYTLDALRAYADRIGDSDNTEPLEQHVRDLLTDLMHLCNGMGRHDFDVLLDRARRMYDAETAEWRQFDAQTANDSKET